MALLAGCAAPSSVDSPSLAKRDYELGDDDIQRLLAGELYSAAPAPIDEADLPPAIARQVEAAFDQFLTGQNAFQDRFPATERTVLGARGAAPQSEAWIAAQMAVSRLDSARASSVGASGELDSLYLSTLDQLGVAAAQAIVERRDRAAEGVALQSRVVAALSGQLR